MATMVPIVKHDDERNDIFSLFKYNTLRNFKSAVCDNRNKV